MLNRFRIGAAQDDEGATLIIAVMVMLILSTLSLAVLSRTLSSMKSIRHGQDYDAALSAADAGLADALYRIDQAEAGDLSKFDQPVATGSSHTYSYKAIKKSETEYEVRSIGMVGGSKHGIRAKVTRSAKYPFALFSKQDMTFNGQSSLNVYSLLGGVKTGQAHVGSNSKIIVNSGKGAGDAQHYFAPNGGCIGCPNPVQHKEGPHAIEPVVAPAGALPCPDLLGNGVISGTVTPGTYVCKKNISFTGVITVGSNSPFILYLVPATATSAPPTLDISTAIINPMGKSRNFQILKAGDGALSARVSPSILNGIGIDLSYNGIMYAPDSTVTINGGAKWLGSWTVNKLVINGGPVIDIGYDLDLETYLGIDWKVSRYAEVPSSSIPLT